MYSPNKAMRREVREALDRILSHVSEENNVHMDCNRDDPEILAECEEVSDDIHTLNIYLSKCEVVSC
jgi:hypothetical protein